MILYLLVSPIANAVVVMRSVVSVCLCVSVLSPVRAQTVESLDLGYQGDGVKVKVMRAEHY